MTARERQVAIMAEVLDYPQILPSDPEERSDCKVLVKRGLLEPNGCLGYRPTAKARGAFEQDKGFWSEEPAE